MDLFTRNDWRQLAEVDAFPCISIYAATHRTGRDLRQNTIQIRNLLDDAAEQLNDHSVRSTTITELLQPARELLHDSEFWRYQSHGLAMFLMPGKFQRFRVPLEFEELVVINHHFLLKPMLPMLQGDGRFYVLAASAKSVRLFEGTRYSIRQVEPESLPEDLVNASNPSAAGKVAKQPGQASEAVFHGEGSMGDSQRMQGEMRNFFERIDRGLQKFFTVERAPLVFAGSEKHFPLFRSTCHYPNIVDQPITAGASHLSSQQLHDLAWPLVAPLFERERDARLERFGAQLGTGMASSQIETIVMAARQGAVDALFVPRGSQCWGSVDEQTGEIQMHAQRRGGDEDLLDHAATHTLLNSGLVYMLSPEQMPQQAQAAALFRYPVSPTIHANRR